MIRELRYIVLKKSDIRQALSIPDQLKLGHLCDAVELGRTKNGKNKLECVVVESDWPEYQAVWKTIENRVDGVVGNRVDLDYIKDVMDSGQNVDHSDIRELIRELELWRNGHEVD